MSEEMKLLKELCNALGFEVGTIIDRKERKEHGDNVMRYNKGIGYPEQDRRLLGGKGKHGDMLDIDEDGMYTSYLIKPVINYKLTKREENNE